ncbi:endonuclease domain-containing protein [uncultured Hymenobacter sp.]|uniref:endonuclease domain-containing protein n=1 Tax=uncultured Hymenobacter sp. TaxID=170016 RepID=UPI0035C9C8DB
MPTYHNLPNKKDQRQTLRNSLTPAEAKLWFSLKNAQLDGRKFRRQHSVSAYILDFYCPEERLAIELDGAGHSTVTGNLHDAHRTAYLNSLGIRVLRFENKVVWSDLASVLHHIAAHFTAT